MPGRFGKKTIDDLKGGKDSPIEFSQHIKVESKPTTKQPFLDGTNRQVHPPLKKSTSKIGSNCVGSKMKNSDSVNFNLVWLFSIFMAVNLQKIFVNFDAVWSLFDAIGQFW